MQGSRVGAGLLLLLVLLALAIAPRLRAASRLLARGGLQLVRVPRQGERLGVGVGAKSWAWVGVRVVVRDSPLSSCAHFLSSYD